MSSLQNKKKIDISVHSLFLGEKEKLLYIHIINRKFKFEMNKTTL